MSDDLDPYYFLKMRINPNSKAVQGIGRSKNKDQQTFFMCLKRIV